MTPTGFGLAPGAAAKMADCASECRHCGTLVPIPDATYNFTREGIIGLRLHAMPKKRLEALGAFLREAAEKKYAPDEFTRRIASFGDQFKRVGKWVRDDPTGGVALINFLLRLLTPILMLLASRESISVKDVEEVFDKEQRKDQEIGVKSAPQAGKKKTSLKKPHDKPGPEADELPKVRKIRYYYYNGKRYEKPERKKKRKRRRR